MELGLSLGDASKPFDFMPKSNNNHHHHHRNNSNTTTHLGSCSMALSIGSSQPPEKKKSNDDDVAIVAVEPPAAASVQLDLLPRTPLPFNQNGETGMFKRGFDVNRLPEQSVAEEDMSSSPSRNSGASSFQMDLCMYSGGGGGSGNKRGSGELLAGGEGDNDDEDGSIIRKKLRLSKDQSAFLEESFKEHNTLNPKQKLALAKQLNLRPRQVEVWFQNRRARTKLKQTEVDCEYLKRCCETLTEENRRLHKELQELRTLKSSNSNPFYMQLPATTLTMCPSCERVATTTATTTTTNNTAATTANNKQSPFSVSRPKFQTYSSQQQQLQTHFPNQSKAS